MTLSKNDYLKKGDNYERVIEVLGEIVFPSFKFSRWDEKYEDILKRELANNPRTIAELEADGWTKCTAQEAGAPKESWRPAVGERYFYAIFTDSRVTYGYHLWHNDDIDNACLSIGNVHRTPEEAIAWLKSKLDLKV